MKKNTNLLLFIFIFLTSNLNIASASGSCNANTPWFCDEKRLCAYATTSREGFRIWSNQEWVRKYSLEAKKRNLDCSVGSKVTWTNQVLKGNTSKSNSQLKGLTYNKMLVDPYDGTNKNKPYTGVWVSLHDARLNGIKLNKQPIRFAIGGNHWKKVSNIEFSSVRTFSNMPEKLKKDFHPSLGARLWLDDGRNNIRNIYHSLKGEDQLIFKGICGTVSDKVFVKELIKKITNRRIVFNRYNDYNLSNKYVDYWDQDSRINEILNLPRKCNSLLANNGSNKVVFKKTDKSNPNKRISGSNKTLCDLKSSGIIFDSASFKSIQKDLKVLGFYKSKIDGQFGKGSCKALKEYLSEDNITGKAIKFTKKDRFELQKDARLARYAANKLKEEAPLSKALVKKPEVPKEPQTFSLNVGSLSVEYIEDQTKDLNEYKVRLKTMGSEIDTSVVSKSLFGFENVSSVDVILNMSDTNAYVDFVIDEENTKVKFDGSKAFVMRIKDDSTSNVTSGEFGKALGGLDIRDVAMVGAHCSKIQEITKNNDNFVKFIDSNIAISNKEDFAKSPMANEGIIKIINDHAASCVDTLFAVTKVKSAFLIETKIKENVKVQVLNESLTKNTLEKSRLLKSLYAFEMKTEQDAVNVRRTEAKLARLIDDLDLMRIQLGATSSTDETLAKEVKELEIKISALKDIVPTLELKLQKIQSNIQDANAKLADKTSRETTIDRVLNEASNKAYTLQGEVERFGPQAIAGEETVKNLIIQLKNDYVPLDEFKVEDNRLKELTQVVTESSKEIQLLRKDLLDIRSIEQSYIEKCLADRQCKAVMGERLGVE